MSISGVGSQEAGSNVKIAESTPEVEKKVESVPEEVAGSSPASTSAAKDPKVEEMKVEAPGFAEVAKSEETAIPAKAERPELLAEPSTPAVESPPVPAEELKSKATETESKEEGLAPALESKAIDVPATKSEPPTLYQKVKKAFEFTKGHKNKESPPKEAPEPVPEAPVEAAPVVAAAGAERPVPTPAPAPASEETLPPLQEGPAGAASETKPTASEKVTEKVNEGKGFFNKVRKSFRAKSHSFSGSIADSKFGVGPHPPPAPIPEGTKDSDSAGAPAPAATETPAPIAPEAAVATTAPVAADVTSSTTEPVPTPVSEAPAAASADVTPAAEETKEAATESVEQKPLKEEKPKNLYQKIVRRLRTKASPNGPPSAAPAAAPVVAASA